MSRKCVPFLYNCYAISAQLFIIGGKELRSCKGTTQGDPTTMAAYFLCLTPLLDHLQSVESSVKHVAFADDLTGAGKLKEIKIWGDTLITEGLKYGYYPNPAKLFLIVKQHYKEYAERIFAGSKDKELDILVWSLVISVSKKNISETKYSHGKTN